VEEDEGGVVWVWVEVERMGVQGEVRGYAHSLLAIHASWQEKW